MSTTWPLVRLSELLRLERRPVELKPEQQYQEIGIYCFGRGIFHKTPRTGLEVGDKNLYELREGDLILQVTFAWEGAIALCSKAEHGLYGSTRYPTFRVDATRCFAPFLVRYLGTRNGLEQINKICPGSAGRNRVLSLKRIHEVVVPLPSLPEQRRIVARIEGLAAKINEARGLRQSAVGEAEALIMSARRSLFGDTPRADWIPLSRFVAEIENGKSPQCESRPAASEEWAVLKLGAISFGSFDERENKALPVGVQFDTRHEVHAGDFLMSRANTTDLVGACAIVGQTRRRLLLSDKTFRFHFRPDGELSPQWLDHAMKSPALRMQIERGASGTSPTMKNISKGKVMSLLLPCHLLPRQRCIVAELDRTQAQVNALKHFQAETAAELDALLPSILNAAFKGDL